MPKKVLVLAAVVLAAVIALSVYIELRVDPFMLEFTAVRGRQLLSTLFSEAVSEELTELGLTYEELIVTSTSDSGAVQSLSTNVAEINKLKSGVTFALNEQLEDYFEFEVEIPIGSMTGSELLSGAGPALTFNSIVTGSVTADFRSEFESGGLNQTVHRLYIDISGDLIVIVGGDQEPLELTESVLVGETVIVGDVPSLYTGALTY